MNLIKKINSYDIVVFDFDGIIVDSNEIKKESITLATERNSSKEKALTFTKYFVSNNGIPRKIKIEKFFNKKISAKILKDYNKILEEKESEINVNPEFLEILSKIKIKKIILSGGERNEIERLLDQNSLANKFDLILSAPKTKNENLKCANLTGKILFIGDSRIDYEVSLNNNLDFIFYAKFTQEKYPYSFLDKSVSSINNLTL